MTNIGGAGHPGGAKWSPDGARIVFTLVAGENRDLYTIDANGGAPRRLTSEASSEARPSWSRDGKWILFESTLSGRNEVWKVPAEGGQWRQLTRNGGSEPLAAWDDRLVYYMKSTNRGGLWSVSPEGGEEVEACPKFGVASGRWRRKGSTSLTSNARDQRSPFDSSIRTAGSYPPLGARPNLSARMTCLLWPYLPTAAAWSSDSSIGSRRTLCWRRISDRLPWLFDPQQEQFVFFHHAEPGRVLLALRAALDGARFLHLHAIAERSRGYGHHLAHGGNLDAVHGDAGGDSPA